MQSTSDLDCTASGRFPFSPFNVQPANRVDLEITLDQKSLKLTRFINSKARYRSLILPIWSAMMLVRVHPRSLFIEQEQVHIGFWKLLSKPTFV